MWKVIWVVAAFVGKPCGLLQQDAYYSVQVQSEQPVCVVGAVEQKTLMRDFNTEKEARDFIAAAPKELKFQLLPPADSLRPGMDRRKAADERRKQLRKDRQGRAEKRKAKKLQKTESTPAETPVETKPEE